MNAKYLVSECRKRLICLRKISGERLCVEPLDLCPDLVPFFETNVEEILQILDAESSGAIHIAKQVIIGEFDGADEKTRAKLSNELRKANHPLCRQALAKLQGEPA